METSSYLWASRNVPRAAVPRRSGLRQARFLAALAGFSCCLAAAVWLIWMVSPPPSAGVVLLGADYATNLAVPHNVLGYEGLLEIQRLSLATRPWSFFNPGELQLVRGPGGHDQTVLETAEDWDALIAALKPGFHQPTLIIVLALHGGSDSDGAYLMPNRMKGPEGRLDLKSVITSMRELPAEKNKVLVVEGAQVAADWRLGMLHNDFARRLAELEPEIRKVPNLWVLSGCDVDQRCWASEGLGRSIFGYFIAKALREGQAAGADKRLSLDELYRYVRKNVRTWAWTARGAVQEPVLLPSSGAASSGTPRPDPATVHLAGVTASAPSKPAAAPDRGALLEAWRDYQRADALTPHPSVYSPMRWRAYRASLVRYEQLVLAGASGAARSLKDQLSRLDRSIRDGQALKNIDASSSVNLMMGALNGSVKPLPDPAEFLEIVEGDAGNAQEIWDALRERGPAADGGETPVRPLRGRFASYLLRRTAEDLLAGAQEDGPRILARAAGLMRLVKVADEPLPAEAHFLRMLPPHLSPPRGAGSRRFWRLVARALRVRTLAERAAMGVPAQPDGYPYSEQVHAWSRAVVEEADARRRAGEDRLFAADEAAWKLARDDLAVAEKGYDDALARAASVRMALAARDRAFAELPGYSRWLASRARPGAGDDLTAHVQGLWATAHQLSQLLERPPAQPDFATIERDARALDAGLETLVNGFIHELQAMQRGRRARDWEDDMAAAAVPFPDDAKLTLRGAIWDRLDDIRNHDVEVARNLGPGDVPSQADRERLAVLLRRRAHDQGRLAMAALGERCFNDFPDLDQGDFQKTLEGLDLPPAQLDDGDDGPWWREVGRQGDRIGRRFRALPEKVAALVDEKRGTARIDEFESRLAAADRLARLLDRGEDPPAKSKAGPSARYRRARAHDLLVQMARRAWLDHWYDEGPTAPPYYRAIVARLFSAAEGLVPDLREADREARERLDATARLKIEGPDRLVLTSELQAKAAYRVVADGPDAARVPPGFPVVRPRAQGPVHLAGATTGYRVAARERADATEFLLNCPPVSLVEGRAAGFEDLLAHPEQRHARLDIDGFFRGQVFTHQTEVDLQVVPDAIVVGPTRPRAGLAVRASDAIIRRFGEGAGSIAVVLDCSGSMRYDGKWDDAKRALYKVLVESVPRHTKLSIWSFSQLRPGVVVNAKGEMDMEGNTEEQRKQADSDAKAPEQTIVQQRPKSPWAPEQLAELQQILEPLRPYHHTPLVSAMWRAAATDLSGAVGFKNLVVLTDGNDDRFQNDRRLNPTGRMDIPTFLLEKFRSLGIRVTVVYFHRGTKADPKDLEIARRNFAKPLQRLEPPGQFIPATNLDELITNLQAGLEQKLVCELLKADGAPAAGPLQLSPSDRDLPRWWRGELGPGFYTLRVLADRPFEQKVNLLRSDRMIVDLVSDGRGGIGFRRSLWGEEEELRGGTKAPSSGGGAWRLTVAPPRKMESGPAGLDLTMAIESTASGAPILEQVRPGWVDFQIDVVDQDGPPWPRALRVRPRLAYPAPVWQIDVPSWPFDPADRNRPARPSLTAWWLGPAPVLHDAEFRLRPRPFEVPLGDGQGAVRIEDFALEDHFVEVEPGEPPQSRPCLVVRLEHPQGRPFSIDPATLSEQLGDRNLAITGYEHRYYSRAGKYTGLFWPMNRSLFEIARQAQFSLVSIARLREEAAERKQKVELTLGRPGERPRVPGPPRIDGE